MSQVEKLILRVLSTSALDERLLISVCRLKQSHWLHPLEAQLAWFRSNVAAQDCHVVAESDDEIVGYVRVPSVDAEVDGDLEQIWGISTVIVKRELRGRGLGRKLVDKATAVMGRSPNKPLGLLQCSRSALSFYGQSGWTEFAGSVKCRRRGRLVEFLRDECIMIYPARQNPSSIILSGDSF